MGRGDIGLAILLVIVLSAYQVFGVKACSTITTDAVSSIRIFPDSWR